jgi:hypothetical protein
MNENLKGQDVLLVREKGSNELYEKTVQYIREIEPLIRLS